MVKVICSPVGSVPQGVVPDEEAGPGSQEDHEVSETLQTQVRFLSVWVVPQSAALCDAIFVLKD